MADVNKSVLISFTLSANFKTALNNINTAFGEISKNANNINGSLKPLASSLQKLKVPAGFKEFSSALHSLSQIKSENLTKIQQSLNSISSVRFPDFSGVNTNINAHAASVLRLAESYDRLKTALHGVNLTGLSSQINSSNTAVNNQGQSLRRNTTHFAQYAYAIGSASSGLSILGSRLYGITRGFSAISKELSASLGIFVSVFGAMFAIKGVVKDLVAFDDAMRKTGAIANASSSELKLMTDAARAMGEATRYTAQQAADGLQMLALSGLDARKAIEALPTVLNAAASEGIDLEKAASVLLSTMNAYGMEVKDLGSISDILVATSVNSATSLIALKESMKQVGPVAASAGVSLTQVNALLGTLADSGIQGSKSGTVLKNAITRLLSPTRMVITALGEYELKAENLIKNNTDAATGALDFIGVLEQMREKSIKTGDAMRIFGLIAGPGMAKLLSASSESIRQLYETLQNADGISLKVAYEMEAGVGGSLRRLKSMWEELSLSIGDAIENDLIDFMANLTRVIKENKDTLATYSATLMQAIGLALNLAVGVGELIVSFPKLSIGIVIATTAIGSFLTAMKIAQLTGMTTALSSLIGLNFVGLATKLSNVVGSVAAFNVALSGMSFASFTTGLSTFVLGLKALGAQLLLSVGLFADFIGRFIIGHPYLIAVSVAIGAIVFALSKLNPSYETVIANTKKAIDASKELSHELEYQRTELQLISKGFETAEKYGSDTASLEERLETLLINANIPLDKRVELLENLETGQKNINVITKEFNDLLSASNLENNLLRLNAETQAFSEQEKATEKLSIKIEKLTVQRKALQDAGLLEAAQVVTQQLLDTKEAFAKSEAGSKSYYDSLVNQMIPILVKGGTTIEEFNKQLALDPNLSTANAEKLSDLYNKISKEQKTGIDVTSKYYALTEDGQKDAINSLKILNDQYIENSKEIEENSKNKINAIKNDEIAGIISAEKSEKSILGILNESNKAKIALVEEYFKKAKAKYESIVPEARDAESEITKEFQKASELRKQVIQDVFDDESARLLESRKEYTQYTEEKKKAEDKIGEAQLKAIDEHRKADQKLNKELLDSASKLSKEKIKIEENLQKDLAKIDLERTKVESEHKTDSISIQEDLRDKLRKINQEKMSDSDKEFNNYQTANTKRSSGIYLINQAALKGDENLVKSGIKLIEQSSALYEGLKDRTQATNGVISVANALLHAEQTATKIKLDNLEKEKQKAQETAEKEKQDKINAYNEEVNAFKVAYQTKIKDAWDAANQIILAQNAEINNYKVKIALLDTEIKKTLLLKKIQSLSTADLSDRELSNNNKQLEQYEQDLQRLTAEAAKADITPKISSEKVDEYNKVTNDLASGADLAAKKMEEFGVKATSSATQAAESVAKIPEQMQMEVLVDNKELVTLIGTLDEIYNNLNILKEEHIVEIKSSINTASFNTVKEAVSSLFAETSFEVVIPDGSVQKFTGTMAELKKDAEELKAKYNTGDFKIKPVWDLESLVKIQEEKSNLTKPVDAEIKFKADTEVFDTSIDIATQAINNLDEKSPKALQRAQDLIIGIQNTLADANKNGIEIKADSEPIIQLQEALATLQDKIVKATAEVQGQSEVEALKVAIAELKDKTVHINVVKSETSAKAEGGYIDAYANGGNVFRRLASPFINKGSGNKDDVPALLMKGEFVQKVSAVRKYGKEFMSKLNAGIIPSAIVKHFANGGNVNNGLSSANRYGINSNSFSNFGSDLLNMFSASMQPMIPAYALGGSVSNNNQSIASIDLNLGGKTYQVQAKKDVAKQLIKEMKKYGRTTS